MLSVFRAATLVAAALVSSTAAAQTLSLAPAQPERWDAAIHLGWFGGSRPLPSRSGPGWYDAAAVDGSVGYYWTPNLKLEADLGTTGDGSVYVFQVVEIPGLPYGQYRGREHHIRSTSLALGGTYQFFENRWFHPFVSGGAIVAHETERAAFTEPFVVYRSPTDRVVLPPLPALSESSTHVRPFAAVGFKAYLSERAFFRTDLRVSALTHDRGSVAWRAGFGFDF